MASKDIINKNEWRLFYDDLVSKIEDLSIKVSTSDIRNSPPSADQHGDWSDLKTVQDANTKLANDVGLLRKEVTKLQEMNKRLQTGMTSLQQDMALVQSENASLRQDLDVLQSENTKLRANATTQERNVDKLRQEMGSLQTENADLRSDVTTVQDSVDRSNQDNEKLSTQIAKMELQLAKSNVTVGFHAQLTTGDVRARKGDTIICDNVPTNAGGGYNSRTGVFTVPVSGLYCFLASTRPSADDDGKVTRFSIVLDKPDVVITSVLSFGRHRATCHRVEKVSAGQKIWLKAYGEGERWFSSHATYFTGMLLQPEL